MHIYIYIYRERERCIYMYIYIYILHMYIIIQRERYMYIYKRLASPTRDVLLDLIIDAPSKLLWRHAPNPISRKNIQKPFV